MSGDKSLIFKILLLLISLIILSRLFYLQIYEDKYHELSENNTVHLESIYPSRGIISDRNDTVIVENKPTYDFYIIPKQFRVKDTLELLRSFSISKEELINKLNIAQRYSIHRPSIFYKEMDHSDFASIQSKLYNFKGIFHSPKPTRFYRSPILPHVLGYVSEIGPTQLNSDSTNYYLQGDLIGMSGIEKTYEKDLRGIKGYKLKLYDVNGISVGSFNDGNDATISDLTGNGNNGTLFNGGEGYWDADVYENACLGSCVDTIITSFPFYHLSTLENNMGDDWSFQSYPHGSDYSYQINLSEQKSLYIDTCDPLTDFDTMLAVKDTCGNPASITEFDDGDELFCPISSVDPAYYVSIIDSITLQAGTYYLIVDGWSGDVGNYALAVGTLPEIISSDIADDDSYLEIRFSEDM